MTTEAPRRRWTLADFGARFVSIELVQCEDAVSVMAYATRADESYVGCLIRMDELPRGSMLRET